jgi:hypothetical protein
VCVCIRIEGLGIFEASVAMRLPTRNVSSKAIDGGPFVRQRYSFLHFDVGEDH